MGTLPVNEVDLDELLDTEPSMCNTETTTPPLAQLPAQPSAQLKTNENCCARWHSLVKEYVYRRRKYLVSLLFGTLAFLGGIEGTYSPAHSLTCSLTLSRTHLLTHSLTHSLTYSLLLTYLLLLTHSYSLIYSRTHLLTSLYLAGGSFPPYIGFLLILVSLWTFYPLVFLDSKSPFNIVIKAVLTHLLTHSLTYLLTHLGCFFSNCFIDNWLTFTS